MCVYALCLLFISFLLSQVAQENMDAFKDAWENQVRILTESVDDITTIDDFLAVSGMFIFVTNIIFALRCNLLLLPMI